MFIVMGTTIVITGNMSAYSDISANGNNEYRIIHHSVIGVRTDTSGNCNIDYCRDSDASGYSGVSDYLSGKTVFYC